MGAIVFILFSLINSVMLTFTGYGPVTSWQYWVSVICVSGAYIAGWYVGRDC